MKPRRPNEEAYAEALEVSERMREADDDPHHIAASLLYLHARSQELEALFVATDRYLRFGLPEHELSEMRLLVERLREEAREADEGDDVEAPLPI